MRTPPGWLAYLALCALCASAPARARAQHGTSGYTIVPMNPNTSAMLEVQTAEFELPGRAGVWQTLSPRFEYAPVPWLSFSVRPVVARIDYADGESVLGLSDSELAVKALVLRSLPLNSTVSVGVSGEVPTGDPDEGTGNGHVSLFPFAHVMAMPSRMLMLHAMVGDRVVLADSASHAGHAGHAGHTAPRGSVIMPHSQHELAMHGGARFRFGQFAVSPGLEFMQVLSPGDDTYLIAQLEVAVVPRPEMRVAAGFDLPLLDDPRFEWRSRLMAAWVW